MAEVNESKRALIGNALAELVATARSGGPRNRHRADGRGQ